MADERKIVIEILGSSNGDGQDKKEKDEKKEANKEMQGLLGKLFHPFNALEAATVGKNVIVNQAYQQAKQQIIRTVDFYHSRYFSLREDYLAENTYNNTKATIGKVTGFINSIASGAISGSMAGPAGAVVGAVVGAVGYGINEYINKMETRSQYYQQLNAGSYETSFARERAGLVDNSKGTEN